MTADVIAICFILALAAHSQRGFFFLILFYCSNSFQTKNLCLNINVLVFMFLYLLGNGLSWMVSLISLREIYWPFLMSSVGQNIASSV